MNNEVICLVDMFQLEWPVLFNKQVIGQVTGNNINETLNYCVANAASKIHLFGNQQFCEALAEEIQEEQKATEYNLINIEIEVN